MRKFFTTFLTVFVLAAAIFTCCGQTQAFASLLSKSSLHDCCKKDIPSSSQHQDCQCHHEISIAPSQLEMAQMVSNVLMPVLHFAFVDVIATDHVAVASLYDNGPPVDQPVSAVPLYFKNHTLRL